MQMIYHHLQLQTTWQQVKWRHVIGPAQKQNWCQTDFNAKDQIFAKVNLAYIYSVTGRKEKAIALYNEILEGRDNSFAMTLSGSPS